MIDVGIDRELVVEGLNSCNREKLMQGRIIEAINDKNYNVASFLVSLYDKVCEDTDKIAKKIILACKDETLQDLDEMFGDICGEELGPNACEDSSLSFIVHNVASDCALNKQIIDSDVFEEETFFFAHGLMVERYLNSKESLYKDEFLDYINNNISRSKALRALFRGDGARFCQFNPNLYFDVLEQKVYGQDTIQATLFESCLVLEEIHFTGKEAYENIGFTEEQVEEVLRAQIDLEKIYLASYYIQSKCHGYDLNIDYSEFSEQTISEIREGFEMGENSYKEYAKVRK